MPKWLAVSFLLLALAMLVVVPTRRLEVDPTVHWGMGWQFVFSLEGRIDWLRLGFQFAILGVAAGIAAVAIRK